MPGITYHQISIRQCAESARQVWQILDDPDGTLHISRLDAAVMDIQKHQILTDPSGAFGELQTAMNTDKRFG